ncbi:hypothetical protein Tco_1335754 [Tanacetum coccineum]
MVEEEAYASREAWAYSEDRSEVTTVNHMYAHGPISTKAHHITAILSYSHLDTKSISTAFRCTRLKIARFERTDRSVSTDGREIIVGNKRHEARDGRPATESSTGVDSGELRHAPITRY